MLALASAFAVYLLFGGMELTTETGLTTAVYAVLGTIYAVVVAFSISGVWQNYCASELAVTLEAAALIDLIHTVKATTTEKAEIINGIAINYLKKAVEVEWPLLASGSDTSMMSSASPTFPLTMHLIREVQTIQPSNERDNVIFSHALTLLTRWLDAKRTRVMISKGNIAQSHWPLLIAGAFILFAFHGLFIFQNPILSIALLIFFSGIIGLAFYLIFTLDCPFAGSPAVDASPFNAALNYLSDPNFS